MVPHSEIAEVMSLPAPPTHEQVLATPDQPDTNRKEESHTNPAV